MHKKTQAKQWTNHSIYGLLTAGKSWFKKMVVFLGVVIWIGALSPEIFIKIGEGCIVGEDGKELTQEEAERFMESYFYGDTDENTEVTIKYKIALLDLFL